jgi:hypothetical protein
VPRAYKHLKREWPSHHRYKLRKQFHDTPAWKAVPKRGVHRDAPPTKWRKQDGHRPKVEQPSHRRKPPATDGWTRQKGKGAVDYQRSSPEKSRHAARSAEGGKPRVWGGEDKKRGGGSARKAKSFEEAGKKRGGSASKAKSFEAGSEKRGGGNASKTKSFEAGSKKKSGKGSSKAKSLKAAGKKQGGKGSSKAKSRSGGSRKKVS